MSIALILKGKGQRNSLVIRGTEVDIFLKMHTFYKFRCMRSTLLFRNVFSLSRHHFSQPFFSTYLQTTTGIGACLSIQSLTLPKIVLRTFPRPLVPVTIKEAWISLAACTIPSPGDLESMALTSPKICNKRDILSNTIELPFIENFNCMLQFNPTYEVMHSPTLEFSNSFENFLTVSRCLALSLSRDLPTFSSTLSVKAKGKRHNEMWIATCISTEKTHAERYFHNVHNNNRVV